VQYSVLGPLQVVDSTPQSTVRTPQATKAKILLATLLSRANQIVSLDQLIDSMWGRSGPRNAKATLHVYVSQVRRTLAAPTRPNPIETCPSGYLVRVPEGCLDSETFEWLIREGRRHLDLRDYELTAEILSNALQMWHGSPMHGLLDSSTLRTFAIRLDELRLSAIEMRVEANLALGLDRHLIGELMTLVNDHPYRESFYRQLMIALYRSERQSEALLVYSRLRNTLNRELGLEPCRMLKLLQQAILRADHAVESFVTTGRATA
jgi:SARP family transcriptional regulator, regulator of embCAB operon